FATCYNYIKCDRIFTFSAVREPSRAQLFLLESADTRILRDCGRFQAGHACEETNWSAVPYDPKLISHLIITHADIDHIGRIPRLVKEGFKGQIISTEATRALAGPLLEDARELLINEATRYGRDPSIVKAMSPRR